MFQSLELWQGLDLLAICTKIREVSGASAAYPRVIIPVRAVAQLGRAPGSGLLSVGFPLFLPIRRFALVNRSDARFS
jgi:hypothetical protein